MADKEQRSVVVEIHPLVEMEGHLDASSISTEFAERHKHDPEDAEAFPYHVLTPTLVVLDNVPHVMLVATRFDVLAYRANVEGMMQATAQIQGNAFMQGAQSHGPGEILTASPQVVPPRQQKRGFGRPR